jgi:CheY-like chemotaxis protein
MEVIGQLAAGIAHDFNNMLGVIIGYSDLAVQELDPEGTTQKYIVEIRQAADRAVALTRQLLVFSRKQAVQTVVLDLNDVVKDLDKMLRRLIDENVELMIVPAKQIGRIKADSGQVGQLLMNLVVNARDAMPNGGKLKIEMADVTLDENFTRVHGNANPGEYVMLAVSDNGTGMIAEVKARLFEAFFTTKPKGKGTGLGLATCQTIVNQCAGCIEVQSELGQGTTFKIYFPRVELPLETTAQITNAKPHARGTETLLLVEDEPSVRHLACSILQSQGYNVLSANNGQEGLRVARECKGEPIRLVITDVIMPLMSGKVMAEWLKAVYPDLKILFTSGYNDAIVEEGVLEPGIAFLPKPYTPAALAQKVRELLDAAA